MRLTRAFIFLLLPAVAMGAEPAPNAQKVPLTDEEMLQHLDAHLVRIFQDARKERRISSGVLAGTALMTGAGAALASQADTPDIAKYGPIVGGLLATIFLGGSAYLYFSKSEAEVTIPKLRTMPQSNEFDIRAKVKAEEDELEKMGIFAGRDRREKGVAFTVIGGLYITFYVIDLGKSFHPAILGAGALLGSYGVYNLFWKTRPEIESKDYFEWKEMRMGTNEPVSWNFAPLYGPVTGTGAVGTVSIPF